MPAILITALGLLASTIVFGAWPVGEDAAPKTVSASAFPMMPVDLQRKLRSAGCKIPQPPDPEHTRRRPVNAIRGEFRHAKQTDWAVVCDYSGQSEAVLVFWGGDSHKMSIVHRSADPEGRCYVQIMPVGKDVIMLHYRAYGGPKPPPIDHQGIDMDICEKASITYYFHNGKWLGLQGAD